MILYDTPIDLKSLAKWSNIMHWKVALAAGCLLLSTAQSWAQIRISVAGPMTGKYAAFGKKMKDGAEQAVIDINAAGGVLGRKLVLEVGDDACDPSAAVSEARQLVDKNVALVVGHFCSGSTIPAALVYADAGIIMITPASTNPEITDDRAGPGIYRLTGRDDMQGVVAGNFLAREYANRNIAILHDKTAYGKGLADTTRRQLNLAGKKEELYGSYSAGRMDYSDLVSKLEAAGIDVLYVAGYHTEVALITRQLRAQGMSTQIVSGDTLATSQYWQITGPAGEGTLLTFSPDARDNPAAADLVSRFRARGTEPEYWVFNAYSAVQAWAQAAEQAGTIQTKAVIKELDSNRFDTVLGRIGFNSKGDVTGIPSYVFYKWSNGEYSRLESSGLPEIYHAEHRPEPDTTVAAVSTTPDAQLESTSISPAVPATGERIALVIGNAAYRAQRILPNPRLDAKRVADALSRAGFEVTRAFDLGEDAFIDALNAFEDEATDADWALIYFAGHGIEVDNVNYLVPVDARLKRDRDVQDEAVRLGRVLQAVQPADRLRLVVLDACRNNPFVRSMKMTSAKRSIGRGLARVEPDTGTIVAYAARAGQEAEDGDAGEGSPYATALAHRLNQRGLEILRLFRLVRDDVMEATDGQQEPYFYGSLPGDKFIVRPLAGK